MDPQSRSNPPDPDLGAPIGPIFSKNTKKTGDFEYKPGFFFDSAISQEVGVGSTKLKQVYTLYHPQTLFRKKTGAYGAMRLIP